MALRPARARCLDVMADTIDRPARARYLRHSRSWPVCILLAIILAGCGIGGVPSQQKPSCSWGSELPAHADTVCTIAFSTLSTLVKAEVHGDDRTIRRLTPPTRIADKIVAFGRSERADGINFLHVVPSITLEVTPQGYVGAGFFIVGKTKSGNVSDPETVYMEIKHGKARVIGDQPDQEW